MKSTLYLFLSLCCLTSAGNLKPDLNTYKNKVKPLLEKYCVECHGAKKAKAKLRLDNIDPDIIKGSSATMWHDTYETFNLGEMPPEDELQPTAKEREVIR